ncbi:Esterase TesA [Pseudomonas sp. Bi123]|nr:Esterase TesA [Pseudomonas sp. Bi123]
MSIWNRQLVTSCLQNPTDVQHHTNYDVRYTQAFAEVFTKVADEKKIPLVPFFLDGVGGHPDLMQSDGLHPAAGAQGKLLENVWPTLKPLL